MIITYLLGKSNRQALFDPSLVLFFLHFALSLAIIKNNIFRALFTAIVILTILSIEGVLSPRLSCRRHSLCQE